MVATTLNGVLLTGDHASRPTATTVAKGTLYACSTHSLIYQSDASSWSTWATLTGTGLSDPMTTRGDIIVRNSSNTTARLAIGSSGKVLSSDGTDVSWQTPSAGGGLLAVTSYSTAGDNTITNSSASDADFDATNLKVTFTAPASGNVLVRFVALSNPGGGNVHWTVRESTTTVADQYQSSTLSAVMKYTTAFYISGISAGSHTYKWGGYTSSGTITLYHGSTSAKFGTIIMEVWAAP